ncbi:VCBS repeat-containing protein, partial [candidate division KSB1 bacterium]|nr:VCBS repeat-containing protein [candidate division KSB1 bacterium]
LDGDGLREVVNTNRYADDPSQPLILVLEYDPNSAGKLAADWAVRSTVKHTDVDALYGSDFSGNSRTVIGGFDLDKDGAPELIVNDYRRFGVHVMEYNSASDVFELVWSSPADTAANGGGSNPRIVEVGDLDGDGKWEIVYPLRSNPPGWYIFEWDGVVGSDNYGDTYSSINAVEVDTCCGASPASFLADHERINIFDIDQDGSQEMLIAIRRGTKRGTLITSVDGDIEHNSGGSFETWKSEFFVDRGGYGGGSPYQALPADLDGDGTYEIVNHTWNSFNFYNIDVLGANNYAVPDPNSATRFFQATAPVTDDVSLFGGDAGDVDGDGDEEAYFSDYGGGARPDFVGSLWVVDYKAGDDVLSIDGTHVVKIADNVGQFYTSIFDVDKNGHPNIFVGRNFPNTITSTELVGSDPRNPADYVTSVIYTGEPDVMSNIVVRDSAGVVTTTYSNTGVFASKVQAHWNGSGIDFDGDGNWELLASFQGNQDSITTTTYTWNGTDFDTVVTKILNEKSWPVIRLEFSGAGTGVEGHEVTFITPEDYVLEQNYPNPFNPETTIEYALPLNKKVSLRILQSAGRQTIVWDGKNDAGLRVASGVYLYSLEFGNFKKTKRMTLVK